MKIIKPRKKKIKKEKFFSFLKEICEKQSYVTRWYHVKTKKIFFRYTINCAKKYHNAVVFSCRRRKYVLRRPLPGEWNGGERWWGAAPEGQKLKERMPHTAASRSCPARPPRSATSVFFCSGRRGFRRARSFLFNKEGDGFPSPDHQ